jgi:hypothetical protein
MHSGEGPVGAGPEVEVAGELVEPERGCSTQAGQDDHRQAGRVAAAQRLDRQNPKQQRRPGSQGGGGQQNEQPEWLGLDGVVEGLNQRPINQNQFSHGDLGWLATVG